MAAWTRCGVLQNFVQTLRNLTSIPIEVSADKSSVDETLGEGDTYAIAAGSTVWVRSQNSTPGAAWEVSVDGDHDEMTPIM